MEQLKTPRGETSPSRQEDGLGRIEDLEEFYHTMRSLKDRLNGFRRLKNCSGSMDWPARGVYFFFDDNEPRGNKEDLRVVRVGTHGLKAGSKTSFWDRLRQHKGYEEGTRIGGGNHRGSVFRKHVGAAILEKMGRANQYVSWGKGSTASSAIVEKEYEVEKWVSAYIREMPFLWLRVADEQGPNSLRGYLERNSIALLSNYHKLCIDPASQNWLGRFSSNDKITGSGLWNINHVDEGYEPKFLNLLEKCVCN